ncbi:WD repeat-containing protein SL1-17 [Psilocybe cubensis]|uniref:WD repeat-containing protein 61 n=2 Tax=Psilocybe cubensis TaxID=181762 RepID=A0A8H7XX74_PSICU|nr:WD repeat-containing protein SL1-17 [Psilocybe cubensis]KAH9482143.1 WD repeat-containing protein SL1-17 [Psilocybe cubensis]
MSLAFLHAHDCTEPHSDAVWGVAWTANDTAISVSADGSVKQWSSAVGQPHPPNASFPPPHTLAQVSLSVSRDGRRALYNSIEGLTSLWNLENGEVVGTFESFTRVNEDSEPSWSVSLHPSSDTYASTGGSGNVHIHSAKPENFGQRISTLSSGRNKFGMFCAYSPDGQRVAMSSESGQIYIFDVESGNLSFTFTSHAMSVRSLAWSPDSNLLLSASEDKRLLLHDVRTAPGGAVASFSGHSSWVLSTDISPDGRLGLSGSADKTIKVWDIGARAAVSTIQDTGEVWSVSWRPKPAAVGSPGAFVSGGEDGVVRWWRGAGSSTS